MARQSYLSFDFNNFTEDGLKDITKEFKRNKLTVLSIDADNKPKRQSGVQTKKAVFVFDDGQKLTLQVTSHNVIFQVRLNSRIIPVKAVDDLKKAVSEISDKIRANSKTYQKSLNRQAKGVNAGGQNSARLSNKKQLEAYQAQISEMTAANDELATQLSTAQAFVQEKSARSSALEEQLAQEQTRNQLLLSELEQLGGVAA